MNLILEATRQTILKEHAPGENDLYMRTLELGQVQENDFYSHILHDDLDSIVPVSYTHLKEGTKPECLGFQGLSDLVLLSHNNLW